eukprot:Clim_evm104s210 gene=Clim_evmTU104s210
MGIATAVREGWQSQVDLFNKLKGCPHELWLVFALKFLGSYGYFSFSVNCTSYLSEEFGYSDSDAGWLYGTLGLVISIEGFVMGFAIDYLGVKLSLTVGAICSFVGRLFVLLSTTRSGLLIGLLGFLPVAEALGIPVLTIAIKRYTHTSIRTVSYGLFYATMNIAALLSGNLTTILLTVFGCPPGETNSCDAEDTGIDIFGHHFSARRLIFLTGVVSSGTMLVICAFAFREIEVNDHGEVQQRTKTTTLRNDLEQAITVFKQSNFHRLLLFVSCITLVRMVFRHMDSTFPKYFKREFDSEAWGTILSINPLIIIFLVPIVSTLTVNCDHFRMIVTGSFVSSLSMYFLVINTVWATLVFVVVLSIGEAVYNPRVYDYTMMVSPDGQEGMYTQLASAPLFLAKFAVGPIGGYCLEEFCPGPTSAECPNPQAMWFILSSMSMAGAVGLIVFRNYVLPDNYQQLMLGGVKKGSHERLRTEDDNEMLLTHGADEEIMAHGGIAAASYSRASVSYEEELGVIRRGSNGIKE